MQVFTLPFIKQQISLPKALNGKYIKETFKLLNNKKTQDFNFSGYIEGNELMNGNVNVIVSDGFTGNVALKTAEGTANFITSELKKALNGNLIGKISPSVGNDFLNLTPFSSHTDGFFCAIMERVH